MDPDLRRCVAFIGFVPGEDVFQPIGTGFFFHYGDEQYFATAQHVAAGIGDSPFGIRTNRLDGGANTYLGDPVDEERVKWFCKDGIDIALLPFGLGADEEITESSMLALPPEMLTGEPGRKRSVQIGDMTYTIGLFRMLVGQDRNVPVVHCGNIALLAGEEPIPVRDWLNLGDRHARRTILAHLVEQQSLQGLSGAPVFIRHTATVSGLQLDESATARNGLVPTVYLSLLGVWQGAWDAKPDEILAVQHGESVRVPVGMGVVTPIEDLVEILEMPKAKEWREKRRGMHENLPVPDFIPVVGAKAARMATPIAEPESDNPRHKEDFRALVTAAAKKKPQA